MQIDFEKVKQQYDILHQRTWHYSDLYWKNFLAYGAALVAIATLCLAPGHARFLLAIILIIGGLILFALSMIQYSLIKRLLLAVDTMKRFEFEYRYAKITELGNVACKPDLQLVYQYIAISMLILAGAIFIYGTLYTVGFFCPCL